MALQSSTTFGIHDESDQMICKDELELYNSSMANKSKIIKSAASKLAACGKYQLNEIANRLIKLFPEWKRSTIYDALDEQYKREYNNDNSTDDDSHTITLFEEIFLHLIDTSENLKKLSKAVIKRATESDATRAILEKELTDALHALHQDGYFDEMKIELSKIRQLKQLVEYTKRLAFDAQLIADKSDSRQKIDMALKLGLKLKLTQELPRYLAKKMAISPKWISQIDNDNEILDFIAKVPHCPQCNFNFADFINECNLAHEKGLPLPIIKIV